MAELIHKGNRALSPPTRKILAGWIKEAVDSMNAQHVGNAWRFRECAHFVPTVAAHPVGCVTPQLPINNVQPCHNQENDELQEEDLDDEREHNQVIR